MLRYKKYVKLLTLSKMTLSLNFSMFTDISICLMRRFVCFPVSSSLVLYISASSHLFTFMFIIKLNYFINDAMTLTTMCLWVVEDGTGSYYYTMPGGWSKGPTGARHIFWNKPGRIKIKLFNLRKMPSDLCLFFKSLLTYWISVNSYAFPAWQMLSCGVPRCVWVDVTSRATSRMESRATVGVPLPAPTGINHIP